jgi:two-component system response regulator BaeR
MKILVAEDEAAIANILAANLRHDHFDPVLIDNGQSVLDYLKSNTPELILLDLMLPGMNGYEVCRQIRKTSNIPIIMLTAKVSEENRLKGFDIGADDYICKPFSPREVVARIKSVLRRADITNTKAKSADNKATSNPASKDKQLASEFNICEDSRTASFKCQKLDLTYSEFILLASLAKHPNRVFERSQLLDLLNQQGGDCTDRAIDCHIKNVRRKLRKISADQKFIQSVYGVGYKLG